MASSNFQIFDQTLSGIMPDDDYRTAAARMNGVSNGIADPTLYNKSMRQTSIMAAAIAKVIINQGLDANDTDLDTLVQAFTTAIATTNYAQNVASPGNAMAGVFSGANDLGYVSLCQPQEQPEPPALASGISGELSGNYYYKTVFVTGYKNFDGSFAIRGFSPSTDSGQISPVDQTVNLTNIEVGKQGTIARALYRTIAGGAVGTEKFLTLIPNNTATTWTDNTPDSALGTPPDTLDGHPITGDIPVDTSSMQNTTGTTFQVPMHEAILTSDWNNMYSIAGEDDNQPLTYFKLPFNIVYLVGSIKYIKEGSYSAPNVFTTLPPGFRPNGQTWISAINHQTNDAPTLIFANSNGDVGVWSTKANSISLNGFFYATH